MNLLKLKSILRRLEREFKEFGRDPVRELCEKSIDSSDLSVVIEEGIEPEKELDRSVKVLRLEREESEKGIEPKKLLSERSSVTSCVS